MRSQTKTPPSEYIEIHWTCGDLEEARRIATGLVEARHVACAQIIPIVESIFVWNGVVQGARESKVVLKTRADKYDVVRDFIQERCAYEVPEILSVSIQRGNEEYLSWLKASTC